MVKLIFFINIPKKIILRPDFWSQTAGPVNINHLKNKLCNQNLPNEMDGISVRGW